MAKERKWRSSLRLEKMPSGKMSETLSKMDARMEGKQKRILAYSLIGVSAVVFLVCGVRLYLMLK